MEFGLCLPNYGRNLSRESLVELAGLAEALGFSSIWTTDHIIIGRRHSYPYGNIFESWTTLSYIAAKTSEIKVGTSILILPLRNAILVAKQAATLDQLTEGRLILGVGVGWEPQEFKAMNINFHERGKLMDEQIKLIKTLWSSEEPTFKGRYHTIEGVIFKPLPYQIGGPPIWVGGNSKQAIERAIRIGDGWHFTGLAVQDLKHKLEYIRRKKPSLTLSGRLTIDLKLKGPKTYTAANKERRVILGGTPAEIAGQLSHYKKLGIQHLAVSFGDKPGEELKKLVKRFVKEVIPSI